MASRKRKVATNIVALLVAAGLSTVGVYFPEVSQSFWPPMVSTESE